MSEQYYTCVVVNILLIYSEQKHRLDNKRYKSITGYNKGFVEY